MLPAQEHLGQGTIVALFIHSGSTQPCVPGATPGAGGAAISRAENSPCPLGASVLAFGGETTQYINDPCSGGSVGETTGNAGDTWAEHRGEDTGVLDFL